MTDALPLPPPTFRARAASAWGWAKRRHNVLLFVGGFLFDAFTIIRIDSWVDLGIQMAYLAGLTGLIVGQHKEAANLWAPRPGWTAKVWGWNLEALHFFYGGLLSNYVVLYFKSASGFRPMVFFGLLVALMLLNEMPQVRRLGHRLRLGLYGFCVASFLTYFVPVILGVMGDWVFALSVALAGAVVWGVARLLSPQRPWAVGWPAFAVLAILALLYALRLVPPVPLSVKFQGVYHGVVKRNGDYVAVARKPRFWLFWRRDDRPFYRRPGDTVHYLAGVFAPTRFRHRVHVRWERRNDAGDFVSRGVVPIAVTGGRDQGFRAHSYLSDPAPGLWRVSVETADGRAVGSMRFRVVDDPSPEAPAWIETRL